MSMQLLITTYHRLLADLSHLSGIPIGSPCDNALEWLLNEGPSVDKAMLRLIEEHKVISNSDRDSLIERAPHLVYLIREFTREHNKLLISRKSAIRPGVLLRYLRQALLFCYKAEFEPSKQQIVATEQQFVDNEHAVELFTSWARESRRFEQPLFREARRLVSRVIYKLDWLDITPSHGPGAVYPPRDPCDKSAFDTIYDPIERYYPFAHYFHAIPSSWDDVFCRGQRYLKTSSQLVAKMTAVPKDTRGPRLISVHPGESVWIQQGHRKLLEYAIGLSPLTRHSIKFDDQGVNANMALESSVNRQYCTIDLKDASDLISRDLVQYLFGSAFEYLDCCRATHIRLLSGAVVPLHKMFPMGNASTFPVEALVFWAIVRAGIRCRYGEHCTDIYVFGDDIIVPSKYYDGTIEALVRAGLRPNGSKCFVRGFFRESCGIDAYHGIDVTPLRMKAADTSTVSNLESLCDLAKRGRIRGYPAMSSCLYSKIRAQMDSWGMTLSYNNNPDAQGVYEYVDWSFTKMYRRARIRYSSNTFSWLAPVHLVRATLSRPRVDAWWHLQDSLLSIAQALDYRQHGLEYPFPNRKRLELGWTLIQQ